MKTLIWITAFILILNTACKKNTTPNPPQQEEKSMGPFNIYGTPLCGNTAFVMVNHTGKKKLTATAGNNASEASPEFYLKKSGNGYIVYTMQRLGNDSTLWVWAESPDTYECTTCQSGVGITIALETFKKLNDVSGNKYIFRFNPNGNSTTIQLPGSAYLFSADGIERATNVCNRYTALATGNDPLAYSKVLREGERIWDYSFKSDWYFKKKN